MADQEGELGGVRAALAAALLRSDEDTDPISRVCRACVEVLPVDGASISIMTDTQHRETLYASDAIINKVEELQFTLGEGPCFQAFHSGRPVLVPDLAEASAAEWPVFASAIREYPVQALFALPIAIGAIRVGSLDMYRRKAGSLGAEELATALQVVDIVALALLGLGTTGSGEEPGSSLFDVAVPEHHWEVHQATGMLAVMLGVSTKQAFARLRAHAFATGRLVSDVARDIVAGRLRLEDTEFR